MSSVQNVTCASTTDGSATVGVTGGVSPYQYSWLPQGGNGATATNLPVGTCVVNVIQSEKELIDLTIFESGIYFIQTPTEYGVVTKKIIKN